MTRRAAFLGNVALNGGLLVVNLLNAGLELARGRIGIATWCLVAASVNAGALYGFVVVEAHVATHQLRAEAERQRNAAIARFNDAMIAKLNDGTSTVELTGRLTRPVERKH